jgi:predicted aldo/keto reductase-like oxidoreductase
MYLNLYLHKNRKEESILIRRVNVMQYRQFGKIGKNSALGFGAMRLPVIGGKTSEIDTTEAIKMIRYAIDNGVDYVDTAWTYHGKNSEIVVGMALRDGYREKVKLATKSPTWLIEKADDWDYFLDKQLEKLQTDTIDYYLQHELNKERWEKFKKFNLWEKAMQAKKAGKIRHFGFSFHDSYEVFADILDSYDWEFCQIQLNYLDYDYQAGLQGLLKASSKNIGVVIMEPLRGGRLVNGIPKNVEEKFKAHPSGRKPFEWAFRWLVNQPGVSTILSGMSTFEQVRENIELFSRDDMVPNHMSADELKFIDEIVELWEAATRINCTGCNYCMPCPNGVDIPGSFMIFNNRHSGDFSAIENAEKDYKKLIEEKKDASVCKECGKCEEACPQHIPIMENLKKLRDLLAK